MFPSRNKKTKTGAGMERLETSAYPIEMHRNEIKTTSGTKVQVATIIE